MGLHDRAAEGRRTGERHLSSVADAGQLQTIKAGNEVLHGLVCGAAFNQQSSRTASSSFPAICSTSPRRMAKPESEVPADPSLPDYQRDVQFTVNGQFQPVIKSKAGQTEIWVLANVSDIAYINVQLTETATGRHPRIAIVGQDGNPYTAVHYPPTDNGTRLLIPPASRFAIAVTIPARRRSYSRDAGARRRRQGAHRPRRALHQQWNGQSSGRAGQPERAALGRQLCRRVLRLSNPGAGESHAIGRRRRNDRLRRRPAARRLHVLCRSCQRRRRTSSGRS